MVNVKILMVCLGNICRSPIAEAVMVDIVHKVGKSDEINVDSAAIGNWHVGSSPDTRATKILSKHNLNTDHKVRQVTNKDFQEFDFIFGMDEENILDLKNLAPSNAKAEILLLGTFGLAYDERIIDDPYYQQGDDGFEKCYQKCVVACRAFLKQRVLQ